MYIDTHAHLNYDNKYGDMAALLADIAAAGVDTVVNAGWNYDSSALAAEMAEHDNAENRANAPALFFAAGFHPSNLADFRKGDFERIAALLASPKGVAVGEIGLDYHYDDTDETAQKRAFCEQLELADSLGLPFIVHSRDAAADTLQILKDNRAKLGLYISFAGPVTFKNARRLDEVAKIVPADRILAETDSPYLAPEPLRGTLNTPKNVVRVYEKLAALRGEPLEELAAQIHKNAYTLFKKLNAKG